MINKEFFKLTKYKIILAVLFIFCGNYLITNSKNINIFIAPTDLFCSSVENELNKNSLNSLDENIKNNISEEEILEITDNWIPTTLFCVLPLRIIYYYFVACLAIFVFWKIKKS